MNIQRRAQQHYDAITGNVRDWLQGRIDKETFHRRAVALHEAPRRDGPGVDAAVLALIVADLPGSQGQPARGERRVS